MSVQSNPDIFHVAIVMNDFHHRMHASIESLRKELEERGVTVDPLTGKVTIAAKPQQPRPHEPIANSLGIASSRP